MIPATIGPAALGTRARTSCMKRTRQRYQAAPWKAAWIAFTRSARASLITSSTPDRPRFLRPRKKSVQNGSDSVSPTWKPSTCRRPAASTPITTTTAWETTRLLTPALQEIASTNPTGTPPPRAHAVGTR